MPRARQPLEASLELAAVAWATDRGFFCRKLKWTGRRNAPDRVFGFNGRTVFIEFKRVGEEPRETQIKEIARMQAQGMEAHFAWTWAEFLAIVGNPPVRRRKII